MATLVEFTPTNGVKLPQRGNATKRATTCHSAEEEEEEEEEEEWQKNPLGAYHALRSREASADGVCLSRSSLCQSVCMFVCHVCVMCLCACVCTQKRGSCTANRLVRVCQYMCVCVCACVCVILEVPLKKPSTNSKTNTPSLSNSQDRCSWHV